MASHMTSLGEGHWQFPNTQWGLVSRLGAESSGVVRQALTDLVAQYWKPVYAYLRVARGKSNEDAKDLTQAFLAWLIEGDALARYRPERGAFRAYLKQMVKSFVLDADKARRRLKRGGGVRQLSLDDDNGLADLVADPRAARPEDALDRAWSETVARRAVARVEERLTAAGKAIQFEAFRRYAFPSGDERPTYASVATSLDLKTSDVRNYLFAVRERIRDEIRAELRQTVTTADELEAEWEALFGS